MSSDGITDHLWDLGRDSLRIMAGVCGWLLLRAIGNYDSLRKEVADHEARIKALENAHRRHLPEDYE